MTNYGAKHYGDFLKSEERIGTSVLADRLQHLEAKGIIEKRPDQIDKRKTTYHLTAVGLTVLPLLFEVAAWGTRTSPNPKAAESWFRALELDRTIVLDAWRKALESGSAFYVGPNSVVAQLNL
jgi:DNA-binding HxlR family transcriptional regulator